MVTVQIITLFRAIGLELRSTFGELNVQLPVPGSPDITSENLQSRLRGTVLMALSNQLGALLLTTGNKSELAVGYCTLYGDMNGGLAVLSDVTKEWVYRLARWINANYSILDPSHPLERAPIPQASITKPPSAELRANQTDQDTLPPYPVLDAIVERYVERHQSAPTIARETGFNADVVLSIIRMIDRSEYKRKQTAVGLKVTPVAFGSGRRWPIAQKFRHSITPS
jgi:NAD+ synthetase